MDRANPDVSALYRPLHPAILRHDPHASSTAGARGGRPVAVCGELAGDPIGAAVLVGLGITDLSVTPVAIPAVKEHICRRIDAARARGLAEKRARRVRGARRSRTHLRRRRMRVVPKPWGREEIFAENERYAGKLLHLSPGHSLSLQYHERKDETLYVLEGEVRSAGGGRRADARNGSAAGGVVPDPAAECGTACAPSSPCVLVEVSSPELDDVVRLEDAYGRAGTTAP